MTDTTSGTEQNPTRQDTRFPPGRSGNPSGRPRRHDPAAILREALFRRLAAKPPEDVRKLYKEVWEAGDVPTIADAIAVELTRLSTDGAPALAALARLLEAVRE